jgi:hypothetical protein
MSNIVERTSSLDQPADRASDANGSTNTAGSPRRRDCDGASVTGNTPSRHRRDSPVAKTKKKRKRASESMASRPMSLASLAMEYIWLWDVRHGISINEIALREGFTSRRVHYGVARARGLERNSSADDVIRIPTLVPLFPLGHFTPLSACRHHGPIEPGSLFCCVVCHCSGIDDHPGLQRDPLTDPTPEPKPKPAPKKTARETRKARRQRVFASQPDCSRGL